MKIKKWYRDNSQSFLVLLIIFGTLFMIVQSYYAKPRSFFTVLQDTWALWSFTIPVFLIIIYPKPNFYLFFGVCYILLSFGIAFFGLSVLIPKPYATIYFTTGLWLVLDRINYFYHKKNSITDLLTKFNFFLALLFCGLVLAATIELINVSAKLWWYYEPFPSLKLFGFTPLTFIVGWVPWVLCLMSEIYFFTLKFRKK